MGPHSLNDGRCTSLLSRTKSVPANSPSVMICMAPSGMLRSISRATSAWVEDTWDGKVWWVQVTIWYILPKRVSISFYFGRGCNPTVIHNDMCVCMYARMFSCVHIRSCMIMYKHVWPCHVCMSVCMHVCMHVSGFHKLFSPWNSTRALGEVKSHLKIANFSGGKYYIKEVKS